MKNKPKSIDEEVAKYVTLGVSNALIVEKLSEEFEAQPKEIQKIIAQVESTFLRRGNYDPMTEKGKAIEQLNLLFFSAMKIQDFKCALAVRKEINDLLDLKKVKKEPVPVKSFRPAELERYDHG